MQPVPGIPEVSRGKVFYKRRAIFLGVVLLVVIVAGATAYFLNRTPTSPAAPKPASPYSLQITQVAKYGNATTNEYYLSINATYSGNVTWEFNPIHFKLMSSTSNVYSAILGPDQSLLFYYFCHCLPPGIRIVQAADLSKGQHAAGQIIFKLPLGQTPAKLDYNEPLASISIEVTVPQVSTWISGPWFCCGTLYTFQGAGTLTVQALYPGETNPVAYYTGDTITIPVEVVYFNATSDPLSITISQIADTDAGFTISSAQPALPITVPGAGPCCSILPGRGVDVSVNLKAPSFSYTGAVHLTIIVTS